MSAIAGKRVLVTRPLHQADGLLEQLAGCGAVPIAFPTIAIVPQPDLSQLDRAIAEIGRYHWLIFTSQNGVEIFWERFTRQHPGPQVLDRVKIAAIGPATAAALAERGLTTHYVPDEYIAEAVAAGIGDVRGLRILLPRAEIARRTLVDELSQAGAQVEEIAIYQTLPAEPDPQAWSAVQQGVDIVTFTSSSTVRSFFTILGERAHPLLRGALIACIGPITAATVEEFGYQADVVAADYTAEGLVQALVDYGA